MSEDTILLARASADPGGSNSGFGLPSDILKKSRTRVKMLACLMLFGAAFDASSQLVKRFLGMQDPMFRIVLPSSLASVAMLIGLLAAAYSSRVRNATLLKLALVTEVLLCFSISTTAPWAFYQETGAIPWLHWTTPLIILFPLVVPCPPRQTLITALLAASTTPLGLWLLQLSGRIHPTLDSYLSLSFGSTLAVVIAYFGSRVVYGLGMEVAEARRMGSYHLERMLGQGGMGEVWLARHRLLARPAALKLVKPELIGAGKGQNEQILRRFEREAQATASLCSPHTVGLYDFGVTADGTLFYVMELLDGFNAHTLVKQFGPVPAERAIHILRQICHSLAEAHDAGLVHRDIKPANIYVCRYGREVDFIKVLDFGLVKKLNQPSANGGDDATRTMQNIVCGTPAYMAPEQALGDDKDDARSDIYAVGCVGYWLLTGTTVFQGDSPLQVLMHHAQTSPPPPSTRAEMPVPECLDQLILSCLAKDPKLRPQNAAILSERLLACLNSDSSAQQIWTQDLARKWWEQNQPASTVS